MKKLFEKLAKWVKPPSLRKAQKSLMLMDCAIDCEIKAKAFEIQDNPYKAGEQSGMAKIYKIWAFSVTEKNET